MKNFKNFKQVRLFDNFKPLLLFLFCIAQIQIFAVNRTWVGTTAVFNTVTNWSPSTGTITNVDNLTVGTVTGTNVYPIISGNSNCLNIELTGNAVIDFQGSGTLNVHGNLTNSTSNEFAFDGLSGTISFRGNSNTTVSGNLYLYKAIVNKTNSSFKVSLATNSNIYIRYSLKLQVGDIDGSASGASLILDAIDASGNWQTAYLEGSSSGNDVIGQIKVRQIVRDNLKTYHYLSSPVLDNGQSYSTVSNLDPYTDQADIYNGSYTFPTTPIPDFIYYDETTADPNFNGLSADPQYGWKGTNPLTANDKRVVAGQGFNARFKPFFTNSIPQPIQWTGIPNNGNIISPTLTFTNNNEWADGSHLLGNPYPSPIDWQSVYDDVQEFPVIAVWQNNGTEYGGSYLIYDAQDNANSTLPDGRIAIGQGFFLNVLSSSSSNFTWKNSHRSYTVDPSFYKLTPIYAVDLNLGGINNKDIALIHFNQEGKNVKNIKKRFNPQNSIYTLNENQTLNVLNIDFPNAASEIPIGIRIAKNGNYFIDGAHILIPTNSHKVFLEDKLQNKIVEVEEGFRYNFSSASGTFDNRFVIRIISSNLINTISNSPFSNFATLSSNILTFQLGDFETRVANATLTDLSGRELWKGSVEIKNGKGELDKLHSIPNGILILTVDGKQNPTVLKIVNQQ